MNEKKTGKKNMENKKYAADQEEHEEIEETGKDDHGSHKNDLDVKLEQLHSELEAEKERHMRTRADFDNYRKRMEREVETKRIHAKKDILLDLLTFLDYFEQARKQVQDPAAAEGINIMARQFYELLNKHGVRPVECLGKPFDPENQEGIGYVETDRYPAGCVAEEICTGYQLGDILLKPARVMVARNPAEGNNKENGDQTNQDEGEQ